MKMAIFGIWVRWRGNIRQEFGFSRLHQFARYQPHQSPKRQRRNQDIASCPLLALQALMNSKSLPIRLDCRNPFEKL
jgi:hypothetical protein